MFKTDKNKLITYLKNLTSIGSPSGYTHKVMNYIEEELSRLQIPYKITNKGALIVSFEGKNKDYERTFTAHVDTLGAIVKNLNSKGTLSFLPIGGFMMNSIEGENCTIECSNGKSYSGTIQTIKPSVHISGDEARYSYR